MRELSDDELSQRLKEFEARYGMESQDFYDKWTRGETEDLHEYFEWVNLCDAAIYRAANRVVA